MRQHMLWFALSLLLLLMGGALLYPTLTAARAEPPPVAVAPSLWDATEDGGTSDFFVVLREQADLSGAAQLADKEAKGAYVHQALLESAQRSQPALRRFLKARGVPYRSYYIVNALFVEGGTRELLVELSTRPDVARIEANPALTNALPAPHSAPDRRPQRVLAVEPGIRYVNADDVWALGFTGQGIVVGGQDTGYAWSHPALVNQYRGWDGQQATHDYNWHDSIHDSFGPCGADSPEPCDDHGHGTHTMGTAVGSDGGNNQIGMAPGAQWIGCRNMNGGIGSPATYLECFEFFLAPYPVGGTFEQGDSARAPHVTVNSWSCPAREGCAQDSLRQALDAQVAAGIMTVVSAGNSGMACSTITDPPSHYDNAYTVGALNTGSDSLASFSSRGPIRVDGSNRVKPDISAPGTNTISSIPGGGYAGMSGTSMAGPHVAGGVALFLSARPDLIGQTSEIERYLNESSVPIQSGDCNSSAIPNNLYGHGRMDIAVAVRAALGLPQPSPTPTATITPTSLPTATTTATVSATATTQVSHYPLFLPLLRP